MAGGFLFIGNKNARRSSWRFQSGFQTSAPQLADVSLRQSHSSAVRGMVCGYRDGELFEMNDL